MSIKSSFKKREKNIGGNTQTGVDVTNNLPCGVKAAFNNNLGIISSGNKDFDKLINGGINLGSVICYELDSHSNFGQSLLAYLTAENLSHSNHFTGLVNLSDWKGIDSTEEQHISFNLNRFIDLIPLNRDYSRCEVSEEGSKSTVDEKGDNLTIAWQYRKYLTKDNVDNKQLGNGDTEKLPYCCSFDLSQRLQYELLSRMELIRSKPRNCTLESYLDSIYDEIKKFVTSRVQYSNQCAQIIIPNFEDILIMFQGCHYRTISRFIMKLKQFIWNKKVNVAFSICNIAENNGNQNRSSDAFEHFSDLCVSLESFASRGHVVPDEFRLFHGFLSFRSFSQRDVLSIYKIPASRFGLVRDRRRLSIEALHLPPENSRAFVKEKGSGDSKSITSADTSDGLLRVNSSHENHDHQSHDHDHKHDHQSEVSNTNDSSNSLKSSLAALRAAREAAKQTASESALKNNVLLHQPVNISSKKTTKNTDIINSKGVPDF